MALLSFAVSLYFFIAAQISQVVQPIWIKLTDQLGQFGHQ